MIGAHSDHIGMSDTNPPVEHDSLKAYNMVARVEGADSRGAAPPTPEQWVRINAIKDSLRRVYPARLDSDEQWRRRRRLGFGFDSGDRRSVRERAGEAQAVADLHLADR